jgi:small-conductance mechanosensitive channel
MILRLSYWVEKPGFAWTVKFDLLEEIKKAFDKNKIEFPYPHRTIVYKNEKSGKKK